MAKWQSLFAYTTENKLCNTAKNKTAKHTKYTKNEKALTLVYKHYILNLQYE